MINEQDIIECNYLTEERYDNLYKIVNNTENTWQNDRKINEKFKDTKIGKEAESILENYIIKNIKELRYISYDRFRSDNFKKHAPFDGLLYKKDSIPKELLKKVIYSINRDIYLNSYGKISFNTKKNNQ